MPDLTIPAVGMMRAAERVHSTAARIAHASLPDDAAPTDVIELTPAMVALLDARNEYLANLQAARVIDETNRTLLDEMGRSST